jgi:hypothetical protein
LLHRLGRLVASLPGLLPLTPLTGLPAGLHLIAGPLRAVGRLLRLLAPGPGLLAQLVELLPDVAGLVLEVLLPRGLLGTTRPGVFRQLVELLVDVRLPAGQVFRLLPGLAAGLVLGHLLHRLGGLLAGLLRLAQVPVPDLVGRLFRRVGRLPRLLRLVGLLALPIGDGLRQLFRLLSDLLLLLGQLLDRVVLTGALPGQLVGGLHGLVA